ncbi:hypothetical protein OSTOST_01115 [Ostertagia ostertagi]
MRWAPNGQSVLLRCCTIKVPNKIYVGTDLVTAGSYYEGGVVAKKDMYYPKGREYDFIANVRTEHVLLRCCTIKVPNKIYVGTDLVTAGSYYEGGVVAKKDMYYPKGREYDFIANVRTEQGGVRVWVYRIACGEKDRRVEFEPIMVAQPQQPLSQPSVERLTVSEFSHYTITSSLGIIVLNVCQPRTQGTSKQNQNVL